MQYFNEIAVILFLISWSPFIGKLFRENPKKKVSIYSRLTAIQIISKRKAFCSQRILESSCGRKETVVINILIRKIIQTVIMSENEEVEPLQPVQVSIYQSNIFRKDIHWLHFEHEPRVQERQQLKDQQSYISVSGVYVSTSLNRFTELKRNLKRKELHRTNHGSNSWRLIQQISLNVRALLCLQSQVLMHKS